MRPGAISYRFWHQIDAAKIERRRLGVGRLRREIDASDLVSLSGECCGDDLAKRAEIRP